VNSVHDMGGMHGLGRVEHEQNEPVFHAPWEGRVFAMIVATAAWRKWTLDGFRYQNELIAASEYLRMSYYEKWFTAVTKLLLGSGLVTDAELESGRPAPDSFQATPPLTAEKVPALRRSGALASREAAVTPRFHAGQLVRTRNINPTGHTRCTFFPTPTLNRRTRSRSTFIRFVSRRANCGASRLRRATRFTSISGTIISNRGTIISIWPDSIS
jgi:nitrile hydratase beta subunit